MRVTLPLDSCVQMQEWSDFERRCCFPAFHGGFGMYCARAVREHRRRSPSAAQTVAIVRTSIAAVHMVSILACSASL